MESLRSVWGRGGTAIGAWVSLPSPLVAEITARSGVDYVCIDTQHGAVEYSDIVAMIPSIVLGGARPVVRVPWNEPGIIGKSLDAGAHGVIVPMIETPDQAEAAVRATRYAPRGGRSYGPTAARLRMGDVPEMEWAAEHVVLAVMIETELALTHLDDILSIDGIDAVYVGPADLSVTLGLPPRNNDDDPRFAAGLQQVLDACRRHDVVPGVHAVGVVEQRLTAGFRMVTVASDVAAIKSGLGTVVAGARGAID